MFQKTENSNISVQTFDYNKTYQNAYGIQATIESPAVQVCFLII